MSSRTITAWVLVAVAAILIVWDIVVASNRHRGDTISELLLNTSTSHLIVPLAMGILMGHLFYLASAPFSFRNPIYVHLLGILLGVLLWSQAPNR